MKIRLCAFSDEAGSELFCQINALKRNRIEMTELRSVGGKNVKDLTLTEAYEISATLKDNAIKVWAIGSPIGKTEIDVDFDEYLKTVRHICELAGIFECDKIRVFSFFNTLNKSGKVIERMQTLVDTASEFGITLYHENEKDIYGDTAERVGELLDKVCGLQSVFDPANYIQVGQDIDSAIKLLFDRTGYFHIKDVKKDTEQLVPAGLGDGKIETMLKMLPRDSVLTIEPHLKVFEGYAAIDSSEMKNAYDYKSNDEAFDAAVKALKGLLEKAGYSEITENGEIIWKRD